MKIEERTACIALARRIFSLVPNDNEIIEAAKPWKLTIAEVNDARKFFESEARHIAEKLEMKK